MRERAGIELRGLPWGRGPPIGAWSLDEAGLGARRRANSRHLACSRDGNMSILVLLRHGESLWNRENRFTGWTDVDLTERGKAQAFAAGSCLRDANLEPDVTYTSYLRRAIRTLWLALEAMDRMWLPVHRSWRLNERHYGALQGEHKDEVARRVGDAQVQRWRRSFRERPPALEPGNLRSPGHALPYRALSPSDLPLTESLEDTLHRVLPYWNEEIAAALAREETVLLSAHQNSIRALLYVLDAHTPETIESIEVPMGVPLVYRLDKNLRPSHRELLTPSSDTPPVEGVLRSGAGGLRLEDVQQCEPRPERARDDLRVGNDPASEFGTVEARHDLVNGGRVGRRFLRSTRRDARTRRIDE